MRPPVRNPRRVLLLHPFQLPLSVCLFAVAVVFTVFPQALEHSPVSFETRGIIHHAFHYALLLGGGCSVIGLFMCGRAALQVELGGLTLLLAALALNLTALIAGELTHDAAVDPLSGLGAALRVGVMLGIAVRMYIVLAQPTVELPGRTDA